MKESSSSLAEKPERRNPAEGPPRSLVVFSPDWPVIAASASVGLETEPSAPGEFSGLDRPLAVVEQHRVIAASPAARAAGVRAGQRRREAEAHCVELVLLARDEGAEVRAFEPVVRMLESFGVPVTLRQPGWASFPARGPARRLGGEKGLVRAVAALLERLPGWWRLGIADGPFAATVAAREGTFVPAGTAAEFLAPFGVELLGDAELADLLRRLGLRTMGAFAALDEGSVLARFGATGGRAHRLARGLDASPHPPRRVPPDLSVEKELDPPAERLEAVVLLARALAEQLAEVLAVQGLACTLLRVEAETTGGERLARCWSDEGAWTPALVAERLRWQLEAWLPLSRRHLDGSDQAPGEGITAVRLIPLEAIPARGRQLELWGRSGSGGEGEERMARVVARVQGMLSPEAVLRPLRCGGRGPAEQVRLVPFGDPPPKLPSAKVTGEAPWPGRLPAPSPAVVPAEPLPAHLLDARGAPITVDARGQPSGAPKALVVGDGPLEALVGWAGPFPADERWWDRRHHRRRARFQVLTKAGEGYLLSLERGQFFLEGRYD